MDDQAYLKQLRREFLEPKSANQPPPLQVQLVDKRIEARNERIFVTLFACAWMVLQYFVLLWAWPVAIKFGAPELTYVELFKLDIALAILFPALNAKSRLVTSSVTLRSPGGR